MIFSRLRLVVPFLAALLLLSACNMPRSSAPTESEAGLIYTAAARTIEAQLTQVSQPPATAAAVTPLPTSAAQPTAVLPTAAPLATATVAATPTPIPCDRAKFVKDVTIPDGTKMTPGQSFVKTWRLQNDGSCTWNSAYAVVFSGGAAMGAPASVALPGNVAPGETVDVSVTLTAPADGGTYKGLYNLRNASNVVFGLGSENKQFWVQIDIPVSTGLLYDFLVKADEAKWVSSIGSASGTELAFGGADDDPNGTAKIKDQVKMETGIISGKILLMFPRHDAAGTISGAYPAYTVQSGDHFKARLGFLLPDGAATCGSGKVKFQLAYQEGGGDINLLKEWSKSCNGSFLPVDVDLSSLKGKSVQIVFVVLADGAFTDDWAIWNSPRIEH